MTPILQFIDEAHARFYDLGRLALAGATVNAATVKALRDRMVPYMDLTDAHLGSDFIEPMGGRERTELWRRRFVAVPRFVAWAMEYARQADETATVAGFLFGSMYDPEQLLEVMLHKARSCSGTRRRG